MKSFFVIIFLACIATNTSNNTPPNQIALRGMEDTNIKKSIEKFNNNH